MDNIFDKATLEKELEAIGMDREYIVDMPDDEGFGYTFTSKEIMSLCKDLRIPRKLRVLAPQSKYYKQDLPVIDSERWGNWYQLKLCEVHGRSRKYSFSNSKVTISEETLALFRVACQTWAKPKDYIGREFNAEDIIFLREFFRVKKVFGGFMIIDSIDLERHFLRKITNSQARLYLIIDDPIVHLHI